MHCQAGPSVLYFQAVGSSPGLFMSEVFTGHCCAAHFVKLLLLLHCQTTARGEIQISAGFLNHLVVNLVAFLCEIYIKLLL